MNRGVWVLLGAQFLSAFADNAILFTAVAMLAQAPRGEWYLPALQAAFLVAFVVFAPWVGSFADRRPKPQVLLIGNLLKGAGAALMLAQVEPILAYALIGTGAAVYGPAKYGILPEIVGARSLVYSNGLIEGSTVLAIILGTVVGAQIADRSVMGALIMVVSCYAVSALVTLALPRLVPAHPGEALGPAQFLRTMREMFVSARARFSMLGVSLFWAAAAVLRLLLIAWVPAVLALHGASDVAGLTLFLAIGIVLGSLIVPLFISIERLRRARLAAYAMGLCILAFSQVDELWPARIGLIAIGMAGGIFVVPVNAALQDIGHRGIGSGRAVALQNFFENVAMLLCVGAYGVAAQLGAGPVASLVAVGVFVLIATSLVSWHLPPDPNRAGATQDK